MSTKTGAFNSFSTTLRYYYQLLPAYIPKTAVGSFVASGILRLALSPSDWRTALLGGIISATATMIESWTRCPSVSICPRNASLTNGVRILLSGMSAISLVSLAQPWIHVVHKAIPLFFETGPFLTLASSAMLAINRDNLYYNNALYYIL